MYTNFEIHDIYREIFEKSSAALLLTNSAGEIVMVNNSFCLMSGFTKDELIGIKWASKLPPEDVSLLQEFNQRRMLKEPNIPNEHEIRYYTKNGNLKYALLSVALIEQASLTLCTFLDITERKAIEQEVLITKEYYQSILEYADDIIFSISPDGYFNYISPVIMEKLGYPPQEIIGLSITHFIHPDDQEHALQCFEKAVTKNEKLPGIEFRTLHKNGKWHWFSISASPVRDNQGNISAIIGIGNDITDRINIQNALQRSENFLRTLLNHIPDMVWLKNSIGVFITCNESFQKFIGKNKNEIIGKTDYDLLSKEDADAVTQIDKKVIAENNVSKNEEKLFFPGVNSVRFLETIKTPVYSDNCELIGVLGIARDITQRKQMEEKLSESLSFFKESQKAALIGSYKYYFGIQNWESSEVLNQILGIGPDYKIDISTWYKIIHPEDQAKIVNGLMEKINQKKDFGADYRIIKQSDKTIRWVHGAGKTVYDKDGNKQFLIGTVQDITERKLAEQAAFENQTKLSIALKLAHLGPWEFNINEQLFYFNDTFYALYKTNTSQMGGVTMTIDEYSKKFIHPEEGEVVKAEMQRALNSPEQIYFNRLEHRIIYANGEEGFIAVQVARIKDKDGKITKTFGINQDITAIKRAEKELMDQAEELRELNAMKDKFFSIIAHDLKGPFTSIIGFSEILNSATQQNNLDKTKLYAKYIWESSQKAMDLLMNLLEWSRAETGNMKFNPKKINLIDTINNVIELLIPTARQKKVSLKPIPSDNIVVTADLSMLSTIFRNLISNALKFTHPNGEIKVLLQKEEMAWLIKVIDNGIGIPEHRIDKMFRLDQNESTPGTQNEKGTGLGLLLCKEFIEKHGGKIWVDSQVNKGSEFCFTIPIQV